MAIALNALARQAIFNDPMWKKGNYRPEHPPADGLALARAVAEGRLSLDLGDDPEHTVQALCALPGIGPWTAQYIALRALHWPDAWPTGCAASKA